MSYSTTNIQKIGDTHRAIYFTLATIVNLLGVACLLIAWKAKGINNDNLIWAMLLVAIVAGSGVLICCFALFFFCRPCANYDPAAKRRVFDVQTVYPTPEFQYFTNTMLNRVQSKLSSRGSDFSVVSTLPASSFLNHNADDSSILQFPCSPELPPSRPASGNPRSGPLPVPERPSPATSDTSAV